MPEGDTIYRTARTLNKALAGKTVTRFESVLPRLTRVDLDSPLAGRTVESVSAVGKWSLMRFAGGLILVTHMRMHGSWHVYRPGERWRRARSAMRVLIEVPDVVAVAFNVPVAEFHTDRSLDRHPLLSRLGPDVLAPTFSVEEAVERIWRHPTCEIGSVILSQGVVAGIGNVFKSEILFACGVHPFAPVAALSSEQIAQIVRTARTFLKVNTADGSRRPAWARTGFRRTTPFADPGARLWVYGRRGRLCRKCGTEIVHRKQGPEARSTYWCPQCQPRVAGSEGASAGTWIIEDQTLPGAKNRVLY